MKTARRVRAATRRLGSAVLIAIAAAGAISAIVGFIDRSSAPLVISGQNFAPLPSAQGIALFALVAGSTWIPLLVAGAVFSELIAEDLEIGLTRAHMAMTGGRLRLGVASVVAIGATLVATAISAIGLKIGLGAAPIDVPADRTIPWSQLLGARSLLGLALAQLFWASFFIAIASAARSKAATLVLSWAIMITGVALSSFEGAASWLPTLWLGSVAGPLESPAAALSLWPIPDQASAFEVRLASVAAALAIVGWRLANRSGDVKLTRAS